AFRPEKRRRIPDFFSPFILFCLPFLSLLQLLHEDGQRVGEAGQRDIGDRQRLRPLGLERGGEGRRAVGQLGVAGKDGFLVAAGEVDGAVVTGGDVAVAVHGGGGEGERHVRGDRPPGPGHQGGGPRRGDGGARMAGGGG